jgi:hypothetical protein
VVVTTTTLHSVHSQLNLSTGLVSYAFEKFSVALRSFVIMQTTSLASSLSTAAAGEASTVWDQQSPQRFLPPMLAHLLCFTGACDHGFIAALQKYGDHAKAAYVLYGQLGDSGLQPADMQNKGLRGLIEQ